MIKYKTILNQAEAFAAKNQSHQAIMKLREFSLDEFGMVLANLPVDCPNLVKILPSMASESVQRNWTGNSGLPLLQQSLAFMRSLDAGCKKYTGKGLGGSILDYGCGWGRLLRLALYYSDPAQLYGIDPWDESIKLCEQAGLSANLALCDYLPTSLPFGDTKFDCIYAFSVFTHLSERAALTAMKACAPRLKADGLLAITVRPEHYWDCIEDIGVRQKMLEVHLGRGFAFMPHNRASIDGDITYGDTSISFDYIKNRWTDWTVAGYDYNCIDGPQVIVFLKRNK